MKTFRDMNHHFWNRVLAGVAGLTIFCMLWPVSVAAHRVNIFAWVEGDTVHTQSKFRGGKRVKGGEVVVYDQDGKTLLSGKTDDRGEFSFKIPGEISMKMLIKAGTGHQGEWTLPLEELSGVSGSTTEPATAVTKTSETPATATSGINSDELRRMVEQTLDQKLKPVIGLLVETRKAGPALSDILGGIGYILGLMGLAAYMHFRRKSAEIETGKKD
jgi:nickel transport protein